MSSEGPLVLTNYPHPLPLPQTQNQMTTPETDAPLPAPSSHGIALVTGAAQGIGRAIALRLADDGFDVALSDINDSALGDVAQEVTARGRRTHAQRADVAVEEDVKNLVEGVVKALGGLDVMVANAGIAIYKPFLSTTTADWNRIMAINVRGVMLCYRYAAEQMIAQGRGGRIIGASSIAGKKGQPLLAAYSASKFAVRGLTQALACELGKHRITVNAYSPGGIMTSMLKDLDDTLADLTGSGTGKFYQQLDEMAAVGYRGTPAEVANVVSFLAAKEAHFITGQSITVDGGIVFD